jgi:hypothetical protein
VSNAPSAVTGVSGDSSVALSWNAPSNDGGDPVTGYTVTPYIGGIAQTPSVFASVATTQTIGGLTNGTAYTFTVIATNGVGDSSASAPSAAITLAALVIVNGTGMPGQADQGDRVIVTFSVPPAASQFCSSWTATTHPDLTGANVYAAIQEQSSGQDTFSVFDDATSDCGGTFNFGVIYLGQGGYFSGTDIFSDSTIHWNGMNTLTITLGSPSIVCPVQSVPSVATYEPAPALGVSATISSADEVQF